VAPRRSFADGGLSSIHLKVTGAGPIQISGKVPSCGVNGVGRRRGDVVLSPSFSIIAVGQ
jgi:hypothetical protein